MLDKLRGLFYNYWVRCKLFGTIQIIRYDIKCVRRVKRGVCAYKKRNEKNVIRNEKQTRESNGKRFRRGTYKR